ncbi:MAG: hypothetical protein LBQ68_00570 [Clostridiales bacterium]|jgi:hypothetical protein|nr:hypothetical protein [Clostridiales bacterium]
MVIINIAEKERVRQLLGEFKSGANAVIAKALNIATQRAKKQLPDIAGENYSMNANASETPQSSKIVKTIRAKPGATAIAAALHYKTGSAGLHRYKYQFKSVGKGQSRDVMVSVHKGSTARLKDAFVTNLNGPKIVERVSPTTGWRKTNITSQEIKVLNSVPVGSMFQHEKVKSAFNEISAQEYETALQKHIRLAIKRGNKSKTAMK